MRDSTRTTIADLRARSLVAQGARTRGGAHAGAILGVIALGVALVVVFYARSEPPGPADLHRAPPVSASADAKDPARDASRTAPATPTMDGSVTPGLALPLRVAAVDLGRFPLASRAVADGDTIRLDEPKESVRVLAVDAEEVFYDAKERAIALANFAAYTQRQQGDAPRPRKYPTPAGDAAKAFAEAWFQCVTSVRLEVEEAERDRDGFGRRLAHVWALKDGRERLFAEDLVRAGWSPYFTKYGRSRVHDDRLRAAEADARAERRGIWGDAAHHYPDYPARLAWWEERAQQVDAWERDVGGTNAPVNPVRLGAPAETARLAALLGQRATVFGSLDRWVRDQGPPRLLLVDAPRRPFAVVVPNRAVFAALDLPAIEARFVRVTGVVAEYRGRVQLVLERPEDLSSK